MNDIVAFNLRLVEAIASDKVAGDAVARMPAARSSVPLSSVLELVAKTPKCLVRLLPETETLSRFLSADTAKQHRNLLPTAYLYRDYLNLARLHCKDFLAGQCAVLIRLSVDQSCARFLARLTNDDVDALAFHYPAPLLAFNSRLDPFRAVSELHPSLLDYLCFVMTTAD